MEFKNSGLSVVESDGRVVTGFAAIFGNVDLGADILHLGAFAKTLNEGRGRVKHLWNHGAVGWDYFATPPIARILDLREVLRVDLPQSVLSKAPDATGGLLVQREYLNTERANEVFEGLVAGVEMEMSFGFDSVKRDYETLNAGTPQEMSIRNLREVRLYDTSDVNFGMSPATVADGSKSVQCLSTIGDRIEEVFRFAAKSASLPDAFHKEVDRIKAMFSLFDQPEGSRAEPQGSLTELLAELSLLESLL